MPSASQLAAVAAELRSLAASTKAEIEHHLDSKIDPDPATTDRWAGNIDRLEHLRRRHSQLKADEEVAAQARQMTDILGGPDGPGGSPWTTGKARGHAGWGEAVVRHNADEFGRYKSLLTTGSVPVSVPLAGEAVRDGERVVDLLQLLPTERSDGGRFSYMRQVARTNNAAPVAEGSVKPTSVFTVERVDGECVTIAHLSEPIPRQQIDDAELLRQFVDAELSYGLRLALEAQILNGTGVAPNLRGILQTSGIQAQAFATDLFVTTRAAITKLENQGLPPSGWIFHPNDWQAIELIREDGATGGYMLGGGPVDRAARRLWGVPVYVTPAIAAGTGVLGDWAGSSRLFVRQDGRIDWSENVGDDFSKNLIRFRCEARYGLAITRPLGFVSVATA